jgi:hypothetical protein
LAWDSALDLGWESVRRRSMARVWALEMVWELALDSGLELVRRWVLAWL